MRPAYLRTARDADRQGRRCCLVKGPKGGVLGPSKDFDSVATTRELYALNGRWSPWMYVTMPHVRFGSKAAISYPGSQLPDASAAVSSSTREEAARLNGAKLSFRLVQNP